MVKGLQGMICEEQRRVLGLRAGERVVLISGAW